MQNPTSQPGAAGTARNFPSWLWPDRVIGKRESRELREEHNALVNDREALLEIASELAEWADLLKQNYPDLRGLVTASQKAREIVSRGGAR